MSAAIDVAKPLVVFICYARRDQEWLRRLAPLFRDLEASGRIEFWHDQQTGVGEDWFKELTGKLYKAKLALLLISPHFEHSKFIEDEEIPYILEKQESAGTLVLPLVLWGWHEMGTRFPWLRYRQPVLDHGKSLSDYDDISEAFSIIAARIDLALSRIHGRRTELIRQTKKWPQNFVDITRLPLTGKELFGRREDISFLDAVWHNGSVNVVALIAAGGYGKSALVNRWLLELEQREWDGAACVFGWSFYSQGSQENRAFSAKTFLHEALRWFGDPTPDSGSDWDRGERLARLIGARRSVLILDGLTSIIHEAIRFQAMSGA